MLLLLFHKEFSISERETRGSCRENKSKDSKVCTSVCVPRGGILKVFHALPYRLYVGHVRHKKKSDGEITHMVSAEAPQFLLEFVDC